MEDPRWIARADELDAFARELAGVRSIALDSESDSLHHYREKVCLLQIAPAGGEPALVDPLALPDIAPLAPLFADPSVEKVLHGAPYDLGVLKRDFGLAWAGVFDTQLAAQFLGLKETGLSALLASELGVTHAKGMQTSDWSVRPLSDEQRRYAAADVAHLIELRDKLLQKLRAAGRERWVREESEALAAVPTWANVRDPADPTRVKRWQTVGPEGSGVVARLAALRDVLAREADRPPFRILDDSTILELARVRPQAASGAKLSRPTQEVMTRFGPRLLAAIEQGRNERPEMRSTRDVPDRRRSGDDEPKSLAKLLAWRAATSERLGLDPGVFLPRRLAEAAAAAVPADVAALGAIEGIRPWRVDEFGAEIVAIVR